MYPDIQAIVAVFADLRILEEWAIGSLCALSVFNLCRLNVLVSFLQKIAEGL